MERERRVVRKKEIVDSGGADALKAEEKKCTLHRELRGRWDRVGERRRVARRSKKERDVLHEDEGAANQPNGGVLAAAHRAAPIGVPVGPLSEDASQALSHYSRRRGRGVHSTKRMERGKLVRLLCGALPFTRLP